MPFQGQFSYIWYYLFNVLIKYAILYHLELFGIMLDYLEPIGTIWDNLELFGNMWGHLKPFKTIRDNFGKFWTYFDHF